MKEDKLNSMFNFIIVFLLVSYNYLRMFGMNSKIVMACYIVFLCTIAFYRITKIKLKRNEFMKISIFIVIALFSTVVVGELDILIITVMAITFLRYDTKSFLKKFLLSSIICYLTVLVLYILGFASNNGLLRIENNDVIQRNSLGFSHVNQTFLYFMPILLSSYLLYSEKRAQLNVFVIIISSILYLFSRCRTGYFCTIIFLVIYNVPIILNNKFTKKILKWLFVIFTVFSIFICNKYGTDGSNKINDILSLRPFYIKQYLDNDKIINIKGGNFNKNMPLDNMYIYLLLEKGIIVYAFYLVVYMLCYKYFSKYKKYKVIILVFLVYGLFESYIVLPSVNFILLLQIKNIISISKDNFDNLEKKEELDGEKDKCNYTNL